MKFENIRVYNFENALRGMRNPKNSWHLSDSEFGIDTYENIKEKIDNLYKDWKNCFKGYQNHILYSNNELVEYAFIGPADLALASSLIKGGSEHRKFLRQIFVTVDITAPLFWWKEFDTYKIGTVANSTSTMHTISKKPITLGCFEIEDYQPELKMDESTALRKKINGFIDDLEQLRQLYLQYQKQANEETNLEKKCELLNIAKYYWKELIRWLPNSWLQTRTVTMNYENLFSICSQRKYHKLNEWSGMDNNNLKNFIKFVRQLPYAEELIFLDEK